MKKKSIQNYIIFFVFDKKNCCDEHTKDWGRLKTEDIPEYRVKILELSFNFFIVLSYRCYYYKISSLLKSFL